MKERQFLNVNSGMHIILFILLSHFTWSKGIGYNIKQYNNSNGLSQNTIYSIVQDTKGFMWFGTFDGLNRFDGYSFKSYYPDIRSENALTSNDIIYLFIDSKNRMWISAYGKGINLYRPETDEFISYQLDSSFSSIQSNFIHTISEDRNGMIWLTSVDEGIIKFDPEKKTFKNYKPLDEIPTLSNHIRCTEIDKNNTVWFGSTKGLGKLDPNSGMIQAIIDKDELLKDLFILDLFIDNEKFIWIGDNKGNIYKYETETKIAKKYNIQYNTGKFLDSSISEFYRDKENNLWIGTRAGLFYYDSKSDRIISASNKLTTLNFNFDYKRIESLYQTEDGVFWIGTHSEGIFKVVNIRGKFNHHVLPAINEAEKRSQNIKVIFEDSEKNVWFGKENGVIKFNPNRIKYDLLQYDPNDNNTISFNLITDICEDDKQNIWISTSRGLNKYNLKTEKIKRYLLDNKYENTRRIRALHFSAEKKLYVGTSGQGVLIMKDNKIIEHLMYSQKENSISGNLISTINEDKYGNIWIGTFGNGINKYNPKTKQIIRYRFNEKYKGVFDKIYSFWEDKRKNTNIIWIATSGGLVKFNIDQTKFEYYTMREGLPNNILYAVIGDRNYNLWVSSNKGVAKFNIETKRFVNYDENSGLQGMEFNFNSYFINKEGIIYFGGINGYNVFDPDSIYHEELKSNLIFTKLTIDNKNISGKDKEVIDRSISYADEVRLDWRDNVVQFEFSSMDYNSFQGSNYAYKMEGLDEGWNFIGLNRSATYTNIPSGKYELKITTVDIEGKINQKFSSLIISVAPPYWNTWFAKVFYIISGLLGIYTFIRFYLRKQEKELEREKEINERLIKVDKLKADFLAQMSHEIRTPVNTMLSFSSLIKDELEDQINDEMRVSFDVIDSGGRRLIRTIDLILNVSELQLGTYSATIEKINITNDIIKPLMDEFYSHASTKGINLKFSNELGKDLSLDIDRYTVTQIFINLIDNAIKYTEEGEVEVKIKHEEQFISVEVIDTGIGISDEYIAKLYEPFSQEETGYTRKYEGTGLGLSLVKRCCEINKIKLVVESTKKEGSKFKLVFSDRLEQ